MTPHEPSPEPSLSVELVAMACWRAGCDEQDGPARIERIIRRFKEQCDRELRSHDSVNVPKETLEKAQKAINDLALCLLPVHMGLAEADCVDDPIPDDGVVLSFMGSGASDRVTAGEVRAASDSAAAALSALSEYLPRER